MTRDTLPGDTATLHDGPQSTAARFVAARRDAQPLDDYPGALPQSLEDAYEIQRLAIGLRGGTVGGWKVGRIHPPASDRLGAERLAGPIFTDSIATDNGNAVAMSVIGALPPRKRNSSCGSGPGRTRPRPTGRWRRRAR